MTGNKEIVLPAEAALTFKLQQPLEIKYAGIPNHHTET
jgi:hypothetical protein